jgi:hypothetical protein
MASSRSPNPSNDIAVFQTYVDLINSDRETIWARHNALLVANSLILASPRHQPGRAMGRQMGVPVASCCRSHHKCGVVCNYDSSLEHIEAARPYCRIIHIALL